MGGCSISNMFVELALTKSDDVDKEWKEHGDYSYHMNQMHNTSNFVKIALKDLVTLYDLFVMLRGIAGQGKSTLVNQIVFEWAVNHMWREKPSLSDKMYKWVQKKLKTGPSYPNYSLVLLFSCRELNVLEYDPSIKTLYHLAQKQCKNALQDLQEAEFFAVLEKSLIIVDGIDELSCLTKISKHSHQGTQQQLFPFEDIIFKILTRHYGNSTLVSGRPEACHIVQGLCKDLFKIKRVEVLGFNKEKVREYVIKFFNGSADAETIPEVAGKLLGAIETIPNLTAMSRIPVLLWIICCIYQDIRGIEAPNTMTELFVLACLVFLKKHMIRNTDIPTEGNVYRVDAEIVTILKLVGKLSYDMRTAGKVVFAASELIVNAELLVRCGLLVPLYINGVLHYVFRHLTFQEFLCAFFIFYENLPYEQIKDNENLNGVLPLLSGLQGACLDHSVSPGIIKDFVDNLMDFGFEKIPKEKHVVNLLCQQLAPYRRTVNFGKDSRFSMLFLSIFFEYQNTIIERLFEKIELVTFAFGGYSRHEFSQTAYFLEHAVAQNVILRHLNFRGCNFNAVNISPIISFLPIGEWIHFSENCIDVTFIKQFASNASNLKSDDLKLDKLHFNVCSLGDDHLIELSSLIPRIRKVSFMANTQFTCKGFEQLAKTTLHHVNSRTLTLKLLDLRNCGIDEQGIKAISQFAPFLTELILNGNSVTTRGGKALCSSIINCVENDGGRYNLTTLKLENCEIYNNTFIAFYKAIPYIKNINIQSNNFETICMQHLALEIDNHLRNGSLKLRKFVSRKETNSRLKGLLYGKEHGIQIF